MYVCMYVYIYIYRLLPLEAVGLSSLYNLHTTTRKRSSHVSKKTGLKTNHVHTQANDIIVKENKLIYLDPYVGVYIYIYVSYTHSHT